MEGRPEIQPEPYYPPAYTPEPVQRRPWWKSAGAALGAAALLILKFGAKLKALLLLLPKLKLFTTSASMLVSIGAYTLIWGWKFAVGLVLLLLVHELGHVFQARREGLDASAPLFIPFLGAAIALKELPKDAAVEARVGLAGPILGTLGTLRAARDLADHGRGALPGARVLRVLPEPASTSRRSSRSTAGARWRR